MKAEDWINELDLQPHPEGGYYKETYRSEMVIPIHEEKRNVSTAIYFLLENKNKSHLHRIKSDELWFFHEGSALEIYWISDSDAGMILLGKNPAAGEALQAVIPAGVWFGAKVKNASGFSLVSCTVAPGFDFKDFEMGEKEVLLKTFPMHAEVINEMSF